MRLAILLFCSTVALGQTSATPPPDQKPKASDYGLGVGTSGKEFGAFDILSDTKGVDFGPYLQRVLHDVREHWYRHIPNCAESLKGKLAIEFAIAKDGKVADMSLIARANAEVLNRAAWGGIVASSPFRPLPSEFTGPYIALRFRFYYNPNSKGPDSSGEGCTANKPVVSVDDRAKGTSISSTPSKSGITVNISSSGDSTVPSGGSRVLIVTVTGTKKKAVKWSISGLGCGNFLCGEMNGNLYLAPEAAPSPDEVTLTAVSKADPTAKASITVRIIESAAH